jgi:ribonucleotide reductase class II
MANHTRVFHRKPTLDEVRDSVTKQYHSGEGAIQYAPEAIARANRDIISTPSHRRKFLQIYNTQGVGAATDYLAALSPTDDAKLLHHRIHRYGLNPCAEIIGIDYHCNLAEVHLNRINPDSDYDQFEAFRAATLSVASLLHQQFEVDRYRYSREVDPIVGVSITGLFDFFVHKFGAAWLRWWAAGRSANTEQGRVFKVREAEYLTTWRDIVKYTLKDYCDEHKITCPNRCTTVQPSGTKSLLTGASPGWHPPKARRFIRRITFGAYDPVALACIDYGYNVVPSQSDKDEAGNLLNDPYDDRCTEWLVEIPTEVSWANLKGVDSVDISEFSAAAQFDFYMQVQTHYTEHNTSATIEFRESEIESLAQCIHGAIDKDQGYISAALLARFDDSETYPRLPFEPIDKATYDRLHGDVLRRRRGDDFEALLSRHDTGLDAHNGPAGCDSDKCLTGGRR